MTVAADTLLLDLEVQRFLAEEALLLDNRQWDRWLALWTDDATYTMPVRAEVLGDDAWQRPIEASHSRPGELHYFDDPTLLLAGRIEKLRGGKAWSEQPPSHTTRLITNVHVVDATDDGVEVSSNFLIHRTRGETAVEQFVGTRRDRLARTDDGWRIAARRIWLNANVLDASNLQIFF